jgi:hypothetical protein
MYTDTILFLKKIIGVVTEDDLCCFLEACVEDGRYSVDVLIHAVSLGDIKPRQTSIVVDEDLSVAQCLSLFRESEHSESVIIAADTNNVVSGILNRRDLFYHLASDLEYPALVRKQVAAQAFNPKFPKDSIQSFLYNIINSIGYQVFIAAFLLLDITLAITVVFFPNPSGKSSFSFEFVVLFTILLLEMGCKLFLMKRQFFQPFYLFDAACTIVCFVLALLRNFDFLTDAAYIPIMVLRLIVFFSNIYLKRVFLLPKRLVSG